MDKFIERGTDYPLEHGTLSVYETNCSCRDVKFYFEQYVLTLMISGHKTIMTENLKFEFFPGTFYIPERKTLHTIEIPHATHDNPTQCLVLAINPSFLQDFYEEIALSDKDASILYQRPPSDSQRYFFSNNRPLIHNFVDLYEHQLQAPSKLREMVGTLMLKEILLRVFTTEGLYLLKKNFEQAIEDVSIQKSIAYIRQHLHKKIPVEHLARISGLGLTTFFKRFKGETGMSPADYMLQLRIQQAKILIQKNQLPLKEIAFNCGFNSYEYFCSSFKKLEREKPTEFRKRLSTPKNGILVN